MKYSYLECTRLRGYIETPVQYVSASSIIVPRLAFELTASQYRAPPYRSLPAVHRREAQSDRGFDEPGHSSAAGRPLSLREERIERNVQKESKLASRRVWRVLVLLVRCAFSGALLVLLPLGCSCFWLLEQVNFDP